jgi:HK97 family phage major capsid protein
MPILRSLVEVLTTTETNLVKTDRESSERKPVATLTADEGIGTDVFAVNNTEGFDIVAPFNQITLDNGTLTENLVIDAIDPAALTISTSAVSTIAMLTGDPIYGSRFTTTAEGLISPQGSIVFADYDVDIVDLVIFVTTTLDKLRDVPALESLINNRLLAWLGEMEDVNGFYGAGTTGTMTGIFQDSAVAEINYSSEPAGSNIWDFIMSGYYNIAGANYRADAVVVHPDEHEKLVKMKASDGHYLFMPSLAGDAPSSVFTMRLEMSNLLSSGDGVIADWRMGCTLYDRERGELEIGTTGSQLRQRKRDIIASERIGFGIESPNALQRLKFNA